MIDTHVHLEFPDYAGDRDTVMQRAREAGVELMITVGGETPRNHQIPELVARYPQLRGALGMHPHWANADHPDHEAWIMEQLDKPGIVAIGEIGLDYHYDYSPRTIQRSVFSRYLGRARNRDMPVIVHSRSAFSDTLAILQEHAPVRGVVHCFSYSGEEAEAFLALGLHLSFCGQITFKNCDDLRTVAASVPLDRLLLETDCPFLSPEPYRGKRNEPARVRHSADKHAELRGISLDELDAATTRNACDLFGLDKQEEEPMEKHND